MKFTAALLALFLAFQNAVAEPVSIDGDFSDWDHEHLVAIDPAGDAEGAFDVTRVWLQTHGTIVFLRFDTGRVLNIQSGPREEGTLRFRFTREKDGRAAELDIRGRSVRLIEASGGSTDLGWYAAGYRSAPTYANSEFELRIDLSVIGAGPGDRIKLSISGSDELDEPVRFELTEAQQTTTDADPTLDRAPGTVLRIASLNTWRNGMVDPERAAPLLRLLSGAAPDVIMLQEEYNTSNADVKAAIESRFEGEWNTVKVRDNVISSRMPLVQLTSLDDSYVAAVANHDDLGEILLICVHKKCCGAIGTEEDTRRINQTRAIIQTIDLARARFGDDIPVVLAGDWNLVGSRSPLDMLTSPVGPDLRHIDARHLTTRDVYTWFAPNSAFAPGMLDLAAVDSESARSQAFLVDTRKMPPALLEGSGMRPEDSDASDHLLLVIDLVR
jgi:hypothetical protein